MRWIKFEYSSWDKTAPEPGELDDMEEMLVDIEADRASYLYLRDRMEWASEPSSKMLKKNRWKEDSENMLNRLLRTKYGDEQFATH